MEEQNKKPTKKVSSVVKLITPPRVTHGAKNVVSKTTILTELRTHIANFKYPIADHATMLKMVTGADKVKHKGKLVDVKKAIPNIPISFFPIKSSDDFDVKLSHFFHPDAVAKIEHPTSLVPPSVTTRK